MKDNYIKRYMYAAICGFCVIAAAIVLFFALYKFDVIMETVSGVTTALMPFIIGAVLAYLLCPMCNMFERGYGKMLSRVDNKLFSKKFCKAASIFTSVAVALVAIYLVISILVPHLLTTVMKLVQILPAGADTISSWLEKLTNSDSEMLANAQQLLDKAYAAIEDWLSDGLLKTANRFAAGISTGVISLLSVIMNIFVGFVVAVYLLFSRKKLAKQANMIVHSIFKKKTADIIIDEVKYADKVFSGFITGKILDAIMVSLIMYIGLMAFKLFNPGDDTMSEILIAVIVFIFNIIPFFGWYIGLFLSAILILLVNPAQCIFFVIFDVLFQQIDGNIIEPKIIGSNTGVSSIWVLFSLLLFGHLWGFVGMLVGVPCFAVIYHGVKRAIYIRLRCKGLNELIDDYEAEFPNKTVEETVEENAWAEQAKEKKMTKHEGFIAGITKAVKDEEL